MKVIDSQDKLVDSIPEIQKHEILGFDIEANSLDPYDSKILLIQFATPDEVYVINAGRVEKRTLRYLLKDIRDKEALLIAHNAKFDVKMLFHHYNLLMVNLFDTMLAETFQLAGISKPFWSLEEIALKYLDMNLEKDIRESFNEKQDYDFTEQQYNYAGLDARIMLPIYEKQYELIKKNQNKRVWDLEMALEPAVALMEYFGVLLDQNHWNELTKRAIQKADECNQVIMNYLAENFDKFAKGDNALDVAKYCQLPWKQFRVPEKKRLSGITTYDEIIGTIVPMVNMNSSKQVLHILNSIGVNTDSTSKRELQRFKGHEFIDMLSEYRRYTKAGSAFGEEFIEAINPISGRIHSSLDQLATTTGRFASSGPNLQNIKKAEEYRGCFIARDGYKLATVDYSQIELIIMAGVSGEPLLIDAIKNDEDLHKLTASIIFDKPLNSVTDTERGRAKNVNYAVIYGITEYGLRYNFGWDLDTGKQYLDRYFNTYETLGNFINALGNRVLKNGYSTTLYGRRRYFTIPKKIMRKHIRKINKIKRQGVNHVIQGTSADMLKLAMCDMFYQNPFDFDYRDPNNFRELLTVHDEVVIEYREELEHEVEEYIIDKMLNAASVFVDLPVDCGIKFDYCWRK